MKMRCKIESKNLPNWSRVITTLTSIGDEEVHFAFTDSTLTLTVFDASLSVSGIFTFFNTFFQSYTIPRGYVKTFKLPAKSIMKPFRSTRFIKSCNFCEIAFEDDKDTIVITMGCKLLAEIKYTINLVDSADELHADADPDKLANWIRADPKFMISNLNNFSHGKGLIDLTLKAQGNNLLMKNCATDLMRKANKIYTELTLSTLAFDRFAINEDTEVTFQLRDFKSFIALADHMKLAMTIHFHGALDPVIVCAKNELMEGTLMIATKYVAETEIGDTDADNRENQVENNIPPPPLKRIRDVLVNTNTPASAASFDPEIADSENRENQGPPPKRMRDLLARMSAPFDMYKKFPGHDIVLVEASDDEAEDDDDPASSSYPNQISGEINENSKS